MRSGVTRRGGRRDFVQITDPHLGPFMSAARLRRFAERAVAADPDLVVLTGDFLTMESHHAEDALAYALDPSRRSQGARLPAAAITISKRRRPSRAPSTARAFGC